MQLKRNLVHSASSDSLIKIRKLCLRSYLIHKKPLNEVSLNFSASKYTLFLIHPQYSYYFQENQINWKSMNKMLWTYQWWLSTAEMHFNFFLVHSFWFQYLHSFRMVLIFFRSLIWFIKSFCDEVSYTPLACYKCKEFLVLLVFHYNNTESWNTTNNAKEKRK